MMQITRRPRPRRLPALLLAPASSRSPRPWSPRSRPGFRLTGLLLGAGLGLAGCGDDDSSPTTPAPAPTAPAPPAAPAPVGVPAGLKVANTGADFLEFGWEAVEGATGYEIQMSLKEGDFSEVVTAMVTATTHRFPVAPETTGHARVRAREGDRQSDWSGTATGRSLAAPITLATPRPRVRDTGADFIEWEWDAVENAQDYQVQVADTEDGLAAAPMVTTPETRRRVPSEPETTMYLRVRARVLLPAPVSGEWSAAVRGMSDAAPIPFTVSLTPPEAGADRACSGQVFCPDAGTDAETAMAAVNPKLMVTASHDLRITPMFLEGAPGITVSAGEDATPFGLVDWNALQSAVVSDRGVTFEVSRITRGAGQEAAATGSARYLTCGPFRCSEAAAEIPAAPEITADAVCADFEADFRLVTGIRQNATHQNRNNGVDFGWLYTLSHPATVTHEFLGVYPDGRDMVAPGAALTVSSTEQALSLAPGPGTSPVNKWGRWQNWNGSAGDELNPGPLRSGENDCAPRTGTAAGAVTYESVGRSEGRSRGEVGVLERPPRCARLITDGTYTAYADTFPDVEWYDYTSAYRLQVQPSSVVTWVGSRVAWGDDDPFADLGCPPVTFTAADQLGDLCEDFQQEVDAFWGNGLGAGGEFHPEYVLSGTDNTDGKLDRIAVRNRNPLHGSTSAGNEYRPEGSRHASLWLVNDGPPRTQAIFEAERALLPAAPVFERVIPFLLPRSEGFDGTQKDHDLYRFTGIDGARETRIYDEVGTYHWRSIMSVAIEDDDDDPRWGDLGKIDMVGADGNPGKDGVPENYDSAADPTLRCSDDDGGDGCDAVVDLELSATFTRIRDTDTCTRTIETVLTCTWDADGSERRLGDTVFDTEETNDNRFITCRPG